jgi:hypothetical protein
VEGSPRRSVLAGDRFYFIANAQLRKMGTAGPFHPLKLLELRL